VTAAEDARQTISHPGAWVGIVDDDTSVRTALARALRGNGIRAETFKSAEEYLHRAVVGEPDCIVLDIHLAGMSGFELQDLLGSRGVAPPIVFITGHDDLFSQSARIQRAVGCLRKPFATSALIELMRPYLRSAVLS
jgi:two-component system, LuxR family, response regulator FixJ